LKVYRGVRELGSTDPVLIIHDGFGGSGYLDGRTPDTVDNGNTWSSSGSTDWPITSGYVYKQSGDYTAQIDPGTTRFLLEVETLVTTVRQHGISLRFDGPTSNQTQLYLSFNMTQFGLFERVNGTNHNTILHSGISVPTNSMLYWSVDVNRTAVDYSLSDSSGVICSGSTTMLNTPDQVGLFHINTSAQTQTHDFKVYTPPVEATRKIVWDFGGVYDSEFGAGAADGNPTFRVPSVGFSGLVYFGYRQGYGLMFVFDTSANRSAFLASYPNNFGKLQYRDTFSNVDMTTKPNWTWTLWDFGGTYRCYVPHASINNWVAPYPSDLPGESYSLIAF